MISLVQQQELCLVWVPFLPPPFTVASLGLGWTCTQSELGMGPSYPCGSVFMPKPRYKGFTVSLPVGLTVAFMCQCCSSGWAGAVKWYSLKEQSRYGGFFHHLGKWKHTVNPRRTAELGLIVFLSSTQLLVRWEEAEICRLRLLFKLSSFLHFLFPVGIKTAEVCSSNPASCCNDK